MKIKNQIIKTIIGGLTAILFLTLADVSMSQGRGYGRGHGRGRGSFGGRGLGLAANLTEEQRGELRTQHQTMRDEGADRETIHQAMGEKLQSFGVTLPENWDEFPMKNRSRGRFGSRGLGLAANLTEEQRTELRTLHQTMRDEGADREAIHQAVGEKLQSFGVELPENWEDFPMKGRGRFGGHGLGLAANLTEEQRTELRTLHQTMRDEGADRETIHQAVGEKLQSFGVILPENWEEFPMKYRSRGPFGGRDKGRGLGLGANLSEQQRDEIQTLAQTMRDEGADREAIHQTVGEKLRSFGVTLPENWEEVPLLGRGRGNFGGHRIGRCANLTEDQRAQLQSRVQEMRDAGATRQEIRQEILDLFKSWGIEACQNFGQGQSAQLELETEKETEQSVQKMSSSYPNPFNPETTISFSLDTPSNVSLKIYNIQGQLIRTLIDENRASGLHSAKWDGTHQNGDAVPAGIYIYRLNAGTRAESGRLTLTK